MGDFSGYAFYPESELGDPSIVAQKITPDTGVLLRVVRIWIATIGSPSFTSLRLKLYSDRNGTPGELLSTSSPRVKADIDLGAAYSVRNIYFEFDDPVPLAASDSYWLSLDAVGASAFTENSHVAWLQWYYDPVYASATIFPYDSPLSCAFITADI